MIIKAPVNHISVGHVVVGGGVVGLAIAARLSAPKPLSFDTFTKSRKVKNFEVDTLLLEKNHFIGEETSSRNSEVIHAGIYYPKDSLKTNLCFTGNELLYRYCSERGIRTKRIGKWIIGNSVDRSSTSVNEKSSNSLSDEEYLWNMKKKEVDRLGEKNSSLYFVSKEQMEKEEPFLKANIALCSPNTGIIDSHELMEALRADIEKDSSRGMIQLRTKVLEIERIESGYRLYLSDSSVVDTPIVINSAGLYSEHVARMLWKNQSTCDRFPENYRMYYYKGQYFKYIPSTSDKCSINRLIYPVPEKGLIGLGVHATLDMNNQIKFGPDSLFVKPAFSDWELNNQSDELFRREEAFDYRVDPTKSANFHSSVSKYLRNVQLADLQPDYSGMRPKLNPDGDTNFRDFIIQEESDHGFPGFINLIGIESPGLTSSLAIANYVSQLLGYSPKGNFKGSNKT